MKMRRILVATDFSETSDRALRYAVTLAEPLRAEVVLAHVVEPMVLPIEIAGAAGMASVLDAVDRAAKESLRRALAALKASTSARCRGVLVDGAPAWAIVDTAARLRADLIVMGTHGRGGMAHLLLGSVAEKVVRSSPCSVLTVGPGKQRGGKGRKAGKGR